MLARFWGTRGSIPAPGQGTRRFGGNTSCVELHDGDELLILDAGTGMRELGIDLARRFPESLDAHLLISHTHWDHIQGFPFFAPVYRPQTTLRIWDSARPGRVHALLRGQMSGETFPVPFDALSARIVEGHLEDGVNDLGGFRVRRAAQQHPGGSWGFRVERGGLSVVYATDSELDKLLPDPSLPTRHPSRLRVLPSAVVDFFRGADLMIADAQYTDSEYTSHEGWGHARASTVVDLAVQAGVSRLSLFHHDPQQDDEALLRKLDACRQRATAHGGTMEIALAREGVEVKVATLLR
jgi:phosphoribosyl 1,2-cyclic phosphodiesterase